MGQKVNPKGFRLGINRTWDSIWYSAKKNYSEWLVEDVEIKKYVNNRMQNAGISNISIQRLGDKINLYIHAARPGVIIGKKGHDIEIFKKDLENLTSKKVFIFIKEVKTPELDAKLVSEKIASQIAKRVGYRRALKKALGDAKRCNVQGIKLMIKGRLDGSEMARQDRYMYGRVPLHTLRADIDYSLSVCHTTYGAIGIKVWIYKGDKYYVHDAEGEEKTARNKRS